MQLELPFPPTVNHIWRRVGRRTLLSAEARAYRRRIRILLAAQGVQSVAGRLTVAIDAFPPDRRQRDLDNMQKSLLDALQHSGMFDNDSQIDNLQIRRCERVVGGLVRVSVLPVNPLETPATVAIAQPELEPNPNPEAKPRTCLKCSKTFASEGPWNRICKACNRDNDRLQLTEIDLDRERGIKRHNGELIES